MLRNKIQGIKDKYGSLIYSHSITIRSKKSVRLSGIDKHKDVFFLTTVSGKSVYCVSGDGDIICEINRVDGVDLNSASCLRVCPETQSLIIGDGRNHRIISMSLANYDVKFVYELPPSKEVIYGSQAIDVDSNGNVFYVELCGRDKHICCLNSKLELCDKLFVPTAVVGNINSLIYFEREKTFYLSSHQMNKIYKVSKNSFSTFYLNSCGQLHFAAKYNDNIFVSTVNGAGILKLSVAEGFISSQNISQTKIPAGVFVDDHTLYIVARDTAQIFIYNLN